MSRATAFTIDYKHLVTLAESVAVHLDRSEATISTWIVGHARLFSRLRDGKGCNAHTYRDTLIWFSEHWPDDLEWPRHIPRPSVEPGEAA